MRKFKVPVLLTVLALVALLVARSMGLSVKECAGWSVALVLIGLALDALAEIAVLLLGALVAPFRRKGGSQ
jgi:hypothetical protein